MKYKAVKKFYDPIGHKRIVVGEFVEVPEKYLEDYRPYIQDIEKPMPEPAEVKKAPTIEEAKAAPPMQVIERKPKKKEVR